jgi:hypothetical protein
MMRNVLVMVLSVALATPIWAEPRATVRPDLVGPSNTGPLHKLGEEIVAGIVVVSVGIVVVVVVLVRHRPQRITGCVNAVANGMSVTDEKTSGVTRWRATR